MAHPNGCSKCYTDGEGNCPVHAQVQAAAYASTTIAIQTDRIVRRLDTIIAILGGEPVTDPDPDPWEEI